MKVLLSWMREFAPIEGDPVRIGEELSDLGLAVEEMELLGANLEGVIVAEVLDLKPHPNADKIQLVDVDAGDGEALQICCGAFNMSVGDRVPLATLGTTMPDGLEIQRRKLRGEWSNGMLCSPNELGLGGDPGGILLLPGTLRSGVPLAEAMGISNDVLYDLEVNPNRPDAMSVAGVARDLAARLGVPFAIPEPAIRTGGDALDGSVAIEVLDGRRCGRFESWLFRDVTVGASDLTISNRLTLLGMRPINSLVDVSNYVMLELGRPNHPYDLSKLGGRGLRVRTAATGETMVTLDEVERTFTDADLLICDADDTPVGIAGIMGGAATEIASDTTDVLLEMAWFEAMPIAKTSRRLGIRTEASARFERGVDPESGELVAHRFAELLGATAQLAPGKIDVLGALPAQPTVRVRTDRVNAMLGTDLSAEVITDLLTPIEFGVEPAGDADLDVVVPTFRPDTETEVDVIEEIARHHGYSNIAPTLPRGEQSGGLTTRQLDRRRVRSALAGLGLAEATPMPFLAPGQLTRCGLPDVGLEIANPLVAEESILRTALLPGLVEAVAYNARHRNHGIGLFEIGHVFKPPPDPEAPLPDEREHVAVILGGRDAQEAVRVWGTLVDLLQIADARVRNLEMPGLHPTRSAVVEANGTAVGSVGEIDPDVLLAHDITERVGYLEVDLGVMLDLRTDDKPFRPFSLFPSSDVDLAFEVDASVPADAIELTLRDAGGELLWSTALFDVYRGDRVAAGTRSLAYTLRFQALDRTLTDAEVADARQACIDAVTAAHPATLRG
ncbi:MAG TPA: phenylalanine--tRNA ligase subunit beta [Acidimicrobiales bacterium]|nr:phenylalanine--tRNA ligase subunit beta [Acidimicrobiales bacterium]